MKIKLNLMSGFAFITLMCLVLCSCTPKPADVTGEIKAANNEMMAAFAKGDPGVMTGFYTQDASIFPANSDIVAGQQAIGGFWGAVTSMGIKKISFETTTATSYGNIAIEEGNYALFVDGDQMVDQGKYIVTWKKEDGKWKVFRDIWNGSTPPPVNRAAANENVLIVLNHVKADKVAQFEDFNQNILGPAGAEFNPGVKATVRMQKPTAQNSDGTYTYIYFMDPFVSTYDYSMEASLKAKYGEEKTAEYMKMYTDCLKDGKSIVIPATETDW